MKLFQKWKKIALSVGAVCVLAFSALAVGLIAPASNDGIVAAGETPNNVTIDFSNASDIDHFSVTNSDGSVGEITDGKYHPNAWARNYCTIPFPTNETRYIALDFYLPSTEDTGSSYSQLWLGLITDPADINTEGKSLGMQMGTHCSVTYFYKNAQSQGTYLGQFPKMTFGAEHRLEMFIEGDLITYAMDGNVITFAEGFTNVATPSNGTDNNAYLFFEYSSAKGWIDNITISDCTTIDFSSNLVAQKSITTLSGGSKGTAADGVFKPLAWAQNYWLKSIDTTQDSVLSFDFYMPGYETLATADKYSQFYAALVSDLADINGTDENSNAKSIAFRMFDNGNLETPMASYSVHPFAQRADSNYAWVDGTSYFDNLHHMDIQIVDGVITYYVDEVALFSGKTLNVPADTVYFYFEVSHAGGYIDNLQIAEYVEPPFEEINLDFSSAAAGANNFTAFPGSTNWGTSNGMFKSGGSYRITYMTTAIPLNEFKYIAFDWYEPATENGNGSVANFRFGLMDEIPSAVAAEGSAIGLYIWNNKVNLSKKIVNTGGWLASLSSVSLGSVKRVEMIVQDEKITFIVGGTTLQSSYAIPFCDQDASTKEDAYLVLDDAINAGAYIDNLVVWNKDTYDQYKQEQLDKQYGIEASDKSFVGYDEKKTPNNKDSGIAWGTAYTALSDGATIRRSTYYNMKYDWSGAEYYAFDVVNNTDGYIALGLDVKEGYYAKDGAISSFGTGSITHGRWWTMGEYMPYYLVYQDGTVKEGITGRNTLNRGEAVLPTGFNGTLIFPISAFEILDWSANTASYDWFTEDANVLALNHIIFADVIYGKVTATTGSVTTSNERLLSSDFGLAATVAKTIRAINQIGTVSAASERLIAFARENYEALSASDQALVSNYATLTAAEEEFYDLKDYSYAIGTDGKNFEGTKGVAFGTVFDSAPHTVSAWIKVDRDTPDNEHVGTVVGNAERKMSSSILYDYWYTFSFEITTNGNPKFEWRVSRTNKVVFIVENADVRTGSWMHVAFTRDVENGLLTCYVNGRAVATMSVDAAKIANFSFVKPVMIGSDYTDDHILALSFSPDFHGSIADVRVYSSLLDGTEVLDDVQGKRAEGLLGGVDFSSGEAGEYYDYVNNNATDAFGWESVDKEYFTAKDGEFTFAVIPDTQMIFSRAPKDSNGVGIFNGTYTPAADGEVSGTWESAYNVEDNLGFRNMQWLIDNKDMLNLQYVMHVGDLTDNLNYYSKSGVNSSYEKWQIEGMIEADYGFQMLDKLTEAGIPWSISRGNHDGGYDKSALAIWDKYWTQSEVYAKAMTDDRLGGEPAKYCITTRDSVDHIYSYYEKIEINGIKYLILVLDLEAGDSVLAWANEVASYFTDHRIIVSTHAYLGARAGLMTSLMGTEALNNPGQTVWDEFVSQHSNIQMMICGHSSGEDIVRKEMTGVNGNKVWTFMIDSSAHEFTGVTQPGLMALLKFSADGKTLTLNHYSMEQGELFGSFNSFTVELGELEDTEVGGEDTEEDTITFENVDNVVYLPNIAGYLYNNSNGLNVGSSPNLGWKSDQINFGTKWKSGFVGIDMEADGTFAFDADSHLTPEGTSYTLSLAVYLTSGVDGLTRQIYPASKGTFHTTTAGETFYFSSIGNISVSKNDQIVIVYYQSSATWVDDGARFNGTLTQSNGATISYKLPLGDNSGSTFTSEESTAAINALLAAGWGNGVNYNGYTVGYFGWNGNASTAYYAYTITVNDENGNLLFTAKAGKNGTLPALKKEGYKFLGYQISDTLYGDNEYTVTKSVTAVAKFEKIPDAIMDAEGNVVIDTSAGFNEALPELSRTGHIFIGYMIDGKLYPAGTVYDKASGASIVAVFAEFSMINGASIRLGTPTGMRFQTYLDTTAYGYLEGSVSFGTLIAKADDITVNGALDYSLLTTTATMTKLNISSTNQHTVGNYLYFNGVLAEIKENHYDWKFAARGYMTVTYADGTTAIFYANVTDNARSVQEVAEKAMADVSKVQSKDYATAVDGGFSIYTDDERRVIEVFIKKEDLV